MFSFNQTKRPSHFIQQYFLLSILLYFHKKSDCFHSQSLDAKIKLLDKDDYEIVYSPIDKFNNVQVLYNNEFITVNVKRTEPYLKAKDLYPEGYDLNTLFTSFKEIKLNKDIARGSKKALKKIQKEIKEKNNK